MSHQTHLKAMIDAWADMTTLALRAGADAHAVTDLNGRFFDAKVELQTAHRVDCILAVIRANEDL